MRCFNVNNLEELKAYLQSSNIHDGNFCTALYDQVMKKFSVHIKNPCWNDSVEMTFYGVEKFISISDYKWSENETINCLVCLNGTEKLPESIYFEDRNDKLFFAWEMFSGNEIHIICSKLIVEV